MSNTKTASVDSFLKDINSISKKTNGDYKCTLIRKLDEAKLPKNMREAIDQAMKSDSVTTDALFVYIKETAKVDISHRSLRVHRNKKQGCFGCIYGVNV